MDHAQAGEEYPLRVGVFDRGDRAARAVELLHEHGFQESEVTVFCSDEACERHFGAQPTERRAGAHHADWAKRGGIAGALLGGFGALVGVATTGGSIVLAAGALLPALAGGGVAGSFAGAMARRGVEGEAADFLDQAVEQGAVLVGVESLSGGAERLAEAARLLREAGARTVPLRQG